jgi:hypothetical protein
MTNSYKELAGKMKSNGCGDTVAVVNDDTMESISTGKLLRETLAKMPDEERAKAGDRRLGADGMVHVQVAFDAYRNDNIVTPSNPWFSEVVSDYVLGRSGLRLQAV